MAEENLFNELGSWLGRYKALTEDLVKRKEDISRRSNVLAAATYYAGEPNEYVIREIDPSYFSDIRTLDKIETAHKLEDPQWKTIGSKLEQILESAETKKLSDRVYVVKPVEIKNDEQHNEIARKHKKALVYEQALEGKNPEILQYLKKEAIELKVKQVQKEIEAKISENIDKAPFIAEDKKEDSKKIYSGAFARIYAEGIVKKELIEEDPSGVEKIIKEAIQNARKEFENSFADEEAKKRYVIKNVLESYKNSKSVGERIAILDQLY